MRFFKRDDPPSNRKQKQPRRTDSYTESLQKRANFLEQENRNLKNQINELDSQNKDLNRTNSQLRMMLSSNPQAMKSMQDELVQELKFEIKTLYSHLQNVKQSNEAYKSECDELNQKYQELMNELESEKANSQVEISRLRNLVAKLRGSGLGESTLQPERPIRNDSKNFKKLTPDEQFNKMMESSDDFYIEEAETIPEKDREIMDLKSKVQALTMMFENLDKRNSGTLNANKNSKDIKSNHPEKKHSTEKSADIEARFFKGSVIDGEREGFGLAVERDNRVAIGRFERGKLQGLGKILIADKILIGNFVDGQIDEASCRTITFPVLKRLKFNDLMDYEGETYAGVIEGKGRLFFGETSFFEGFFKKGTIDASRKGILHVESTGGTLEVEVSVLYFAALSTAVFTAANGLTFACNLKTGLLERQS